MIIAAGACACTPIANSPLSRRCRWKNAPWFKRPTGQSLDRSNLDLQSYLIAFRVYHRLTVTIFIKRIIHKQLRRHCIS